jgi:catechol 2,3-dioxygenase-like lactoylglutathione lyase family enzyme
MLNNVEAVPNLAVKDLKAASRFYEQTLGLTRIGSEGDELIAYRTGGGMLYVYRSKEAGTNKATALTWTVADVEAEVNALKSKGVTFEHYDMPGMTLEGDVHVGGEMKVAWFKDPDGNILSLASR